MVAEISHPAHLMVHGAGCVSLPLALRPAAQSPHLPLLALSSESSQSLVEGSTEAPPYPTLYSRQCPATAAAQMPDEQLQDRRRS